MVGQGDDCWSISGNHSASTYTLVTLNNINVFCKAMDLTAQMCLPETCDTYKWQPYGDMEEISDEAGISMAQFLAWNPQFDAAGISGQRWVGLHVYVGYVRLAPKSTAKTGRQHPPTSD